MFEVTTNLQFCNLFQQPVCLLASSCHGRPAAPLQRLLHALNGLPGWIPFFLEMFNSWFQRPLFWWCVEKVGFRHLKRAIWCWRGTVWARAAFVATGENQNGSNATFLTSCNHHRVVYKPTTQHEPLLPVLRLIWNDCNGLMLPSLCEPFSYRSACNPWKGCLYLSRQVHQRCLDCMNWKVLHLPILFGYQYSLLILGSSLIYILCQSRLVN